MALRHLYYRGALKSCNYGCYYCPFAKRASSERELEKDKALLLKFCNYIIDNTFEIPITLLFTPYGEALLHDYYIDAFAMLSRCANIAKVSCQTNLSFDAEHFIDRIDEGGGDLSKIALWSTFHPTETRADIFLSKLHYLCRYIILSAGAVADPSSISDIVDMANNMPEGVYFWLNKMAKMGRRYTEEELKIFKGLYPLFQLELSRFKADIDRCAGGSESLFIDEAGGCYACNMSGIKLGSIYSGYTKPNDCKGRCDCFLAYSNRDDIYELQQLGRFKQLRILI